jgi:hypothetical protein
MRGLERYKKIPLRVHCWGNCSWVLGAGYWVLGAGYWVLGAGYWVLGAGYWGMGAGVGVQYVPFSSFQA